MSYVGDGNSSITMYRALQKGWIPGQCRTEDSAKYKRSFRPSELLGNRLRLLMGSWFGGYADRKDAIGGTNATRDSFQKHKMLYWRNYWEHNHKTCYPLHPPVRGHILWGGGFGPEFDLHPNTCNRSRDNTCSI